MRSFLQYFFPLVLQTVATIILKPIFMIFLDLRAEGLQNLENLPQDKGVIFAANHASQLDAMVIPLSLPFLSRFVPIFFVALENRHYQGMKLGRYLYGGGLFKTFGAYPVYKGLQNYERAMPHHMELLKSGRSLCVFPEGIRSKTGELGRGRGGVGYLVEKSESAVVPVAIVGTAKVNFWNFWTMSRHITVRFGKPMYHVEFSTADLPRETPLRQQAISGKVMNQIALGLGVRYNEKHEEIPSIPIPSPFVISRRR